MRDLDRKFLNDSVAFARSLAEDHRRNADLAERMIRDAVNVTAVRARRERLVDVVAPTERALLRAVDGFRVRGTKALRLRTAGLPIRHLDPTSDEILDARSSQPSLLRSVLLVLGGALALALVVTAARRGPRSWRRRRRRRRAAERARQRS